MPNSAEDLADQIVADAESSFGGDCPPESAIQDPLHMSAPRPGNRRAATGCSRLLGAGLSRRTKIGRTFCCPSALSTPVMAGMPVLPVATQPSARRGSAAEGHAELSCWADTGP